MQARELFSSSLHVCVGSQPARPPPLLSFLLHLVPTVFCSMDAVSEKLFLSMGWGGRVVGEKLFMLCSGRLVQDCVIHACTSLFSRVPSSWDGKMKPRLYSPALFPNRSGWPCAQKMTATSSCMRFAIGLCLESYDFFVPRVGDLLVCSN